MNEVALFSPCAALQPPVRRSTPKQNEVSRQRTLALTKTAFSWLIREMVLDSLSEIRYFKTTDVYCRKHGKHWGHKG